MIWIGIAVFYLLVWTFTDWYYSKIWGHRLRWWAKPFAHGALLFNRRLKDWER